MKKVYTICLMVSGLLLFLSLAPDNLLSPPPPEDLILDLPDELYQYDTFNMTSYMAFFIAGWGIDISPLDDMTNEGATLGRVLFYDTRLSADNSLSCASCHKQEFSFADDVQFSDGIDEQVTLRNSMSLNDLLWQPQPMFFWDLRSTELEDAVMQPIFAEHELGKNIDNLIAKLQAAEEYPALFTAAFGDDEINSDRIASALSQFVLSMISDNTKYDRVKEDLEDFTPEEELGEELFRDACYRCHFPPHFGNSRSFDLIHEFGNNGLDSIYADQGLGTILNDPAYDGIFKSPSLRNVEVTAPYMHDGRFNTLEEVVEFYSTGLQPHPNSGMDFFSDLEPSGFNFTPTEKQGLVAFLRTFTDHDLLTHDKWSNPWRSPTNITSVSLQNEIDILPNPANTYLRVLMNQAVRQPYTIELYTLNGQLLRSYQSQEAVFEIQRNGLPAGVYQLKVVTEAAHQNFKVIFQ